MKEGRSEELPLMIHHQANRLLLPRLHHQKESPLPLHPLNKYDHKVHTVHKSHKIILVIIIIIFTIRCYVNFFKPSSVYRISGEAHPNIINILKDLFLIFRDNALSLNVAGEYDHKHFPDFTLSATIILLLTMLLYTTYPDKLPYRLLSWITFSVKVLLLAR